MICTDPAAIAPLFALSAQEGPPPDSRPVGALGGLKRTWTDQAGVDTGEKRGCWPGPCRMR